MNPQNDQVPIDYLNQIAPNTPKKSPFTLKLNIPTLIIAGIIVIILIIIIANVAGGIANAGKEPWQRFSARLTETAKIVDTSSKYIKNSQLRSTNSDLKLYLTTTQRDLVEPLTALGIDPKKLPKNVLALESSEKMAARLEDGRLNAKYDSTYAREMTYQLAMTLTLLQQLYSTNVGPKTKEFLKNSYDNLQPMYKTVSEFSASNE